MSIAISVQNIAKKYQLGSIGGGMLTEDVTRWWAKLRNKPDPSVRVGAKPRSRAEFWALEDVSFDVRSGEVLGIIGRNGAGKSTFLKILSKVTIPTKGLVRMRGRIASLLEVGTGFHPDLSGRENVFLNGAILGMTKAEIRRKFDEIVAFSECEKFIDTPVKRYSSGMYVRLAFAVAAHLEPEILIVDEVLAVGDAQFQAKCLGKMGEVSRGGRTVLFVSHSMSAVKRLCDRSVVLDRGRVSMTGPSADAITTYLGLANSSGTWTRATSSDSDAPVEFRKVTLADHSGRAMSALASTESLAISITLLVKTPTPPMQIALRVTNQEGVAVLTTSNVDAVRHLLPLPVGTHNLRVALPANLLSPGRYSVMVAAHIPRVVLFDLVENVTFSLEDTGSVASAIGDDRSGVVTPALEWTSDRCDAVRLSSAF